MDPWRRVKKVIRIIGARTGTKFGDNHKVKLGKKRSKTNGVKLSKMASSLWVSLGAMSIVKDGRVYDALTGPDGLSIEDFKKAWDYQDDLDFGF